MMMITTMIIMSSSFLTEFHEVSRCLRHLLLKVVDSECSKLIFLHIICLSLDQDHTACLLSIHPYQFQLKASPPMAGCLCFSIWFCQPQDKSATYLMMLNKYAFLNRLNTLSFMYHKFLF